MIAIIDYNAGNISSVQNALKRLGYESVITRDKDEINGHVKTISEEDPALTTAWTDFRPYIIKIKSFLNDNTN